MILLKVHYMYLHSYGDKFCNTFSPVLCNIKKITYSENGVILVSLVRTLLLAKTCSWLCRLILAFNFYSVFATTKELNDLSYLSWKLNVSVSLLSHILLTVLPSLFYFRGALHRHLSDFNSAVDDYLLALDKTNHDETSAVYQDAQRQLLLTYNDFAIQCFQVQLVRIHTNSTLFGTCWGIA